MTMAKSQQDHYNSNFFTINILASIFYNITRSLISIPYYNVHWSIKPLI